MQPPTQVLHQRLDLDGVEVFYREAGPPDAPVLLLPHGYPCSSYQFRNLMPLLADRWRLLAPDFPACGYSATPYDFTYDFDGYADFLARFVGHLGVERFALYLHDFGSQIGLRQAISRPQRITALIVQNGDIYEDQLGPRYATLKQFFANPSEEALGTLAEAVSLAGYREEFLNEVEPAVAARIAPDLWQLHWALTTPLRKRIALQVIAGLRENLAWFPHYQAYLRQHQPPTLILWGPRDGYMPEGAARAYLRDLPDAELHLFEDGGHWLLETHLQQAAVLIRDFLGRTLSDVQQG
ncbi:alpha/beta fold hydrolase [Pseudomonas sp. ML96]|uniref:alpha/beta fold hydrolase n=1 Tax=Pseudomonas sp. ML96 TaxID=1523503 RepID=UPI0005B845BB|nr:alpha/beta hydrolase [Pseudomonas sp. ML96]